MYKKKTQLWVGGKDWYFFLLLKINIRVGLIKRVTRKSLQRYLELARKWYFKSMKPNFQNWFCIGLLFDVALIITKVFNQNYLFLRFSWFEMLCQFQGYSKVAAPIYIPTNSAQRLPFLHTLSSIYYL